jgi:hypothetical protein
MFEISASTLRMKRKLFVNFARSLLILALLVPVARAQSQSDSRYTAGSGYPAPTLTLFQNEQQAQRHCSRDTVVWLNLSSGIYHFKGQRWCANTNNGAFVCEQEAELAGDRATLNGQ